MPSAPSARYPEQAPTSLRKVGVPLRKLAFLPLALLAALLLAVCGGSEGSTGDSGSQTRTPEAPAQTPTPEGPDLTIFHNWAFPIAGACLPMSDNLMPNAPRDYRGGSHEGVDFYEVDNCTEIEMGTPVLAARAGRVIRVDHEYTDLTPEELREANERIANGEPNAFEVIDLFRGRQVWIDHGSGVVSRYAHLSAIEPSLTVGEQVEQGQLIAYVGDSGTPESISSPGTEAHLHWEVRVGESFLGSDLPPADVRALYESLFTPVPDDATFD